MYIFGMLRRKGNELTVVIYDVKENDFTRFTICNILKDIYLITEKRIEC